MNDNRSVIEANEGYKFTAQKTSYSHLLLCKICTKLMIEPSRLYPCGHTFCKSCILEHNKKVSQNSQSTRQNKCFVSFPQCGKYYITLQPDLLAASLIDDLQVKCLSEGCTWTGPLERFKHNHKDLCKFKEGGLNSWLNEFKEDVKSIKKIREERINSKCIDIDDEEEIQVLNELSEQKIQPNYHNKLNTNENDESKESEQAIGQQKPLLGLNKNKIGDQRKIHKNSPNMRSNIVELLDDDDQICERETITNSHKVSNTQFKQCPINLDDDLDLCEIQSQKQHCISDAEKKSQNKSQNTKNIKQNYTGLKMINSYKKKSHKIVQNPRNMNLTRSQPQIKNEDQNINI